MKDTLSSERFNSLGVSFFRDSDIVFFCFDVTNRKSFESFDSWMEQVFEVNEKKNVVIAAIGNKIDLASERKVTRDEACSFFSKNNPSIPYFETSAQSGENVKEAFDSTFRRWLEIQQSKEEQTTWIPEWCTLL